MTEATRHQMGPVDGEVEGAVERVTGLGCATRHFQRVAVGGPH